MLLIESSATTRQEVSELIEGDNIEFKFCKTDPKFILQQIKRQDKYIKLKRRWLLGTQLTKSDNNKLNKSNFFQNLFLNESILREDDIFYESLRTCVEGAFGGHEVERDNHVPQDDMHFIDIPNIKLKRLISSCLNNFTNKGLFHLAMIVNSGCIKSEITHSKLKRIIKDSLSSVFGRKSHDLDQIGTRKKLFELLNNPNHFRDRCEPLSVFISQSDHAAVKRVMRGPSDQASEGHLSRRLIAGCHSTLSREFYKFSPEVKSLQNDIMNAIWSINKKAVTLPMLRKLKLLVEPEAIIPSKEPTYSFCTFFD